MNLLPYYLYSKKKTEISNRFHKQGQAGD